MNNKNRTKVLIACAIVGSLVIPPSYPVLAETITQSPIEVNSLAASLKVDSNWVVTRTTQLNQLTIANGVTITAPEGYDVTLTVNGIGKTIQPGTFKGNVVLSVTKQNVVQYAKANLTHYFRQALYIDANGVIDDKSVTAAVVGGKMANTSADNIKINSEEENFNGIYVKGGTYAINGAKMNLIGNGGNDFAGFGTGIMSTGRDTTLVVNGADVHTHGAIRPAIIAADGSNLIVKNSNIKAEDGILSEDYKPNVQMGYMKAAPWMLGISGNCRATNVLGNNTTATYINSSITSEGWGVLSTDDCNDIKLTAINSDITINGKSGYGAYAIGNAVDCFYGSKITVPDYGLIITGGNGVFGSSNKTNLYTLNGNLKLNLTSDELKSLKEKETNVKSKRFGVMWHGNGSVDVKDGTVFDTGKTTFLVKGASASINVDGSKGVKLKSRDGVIVQLMDNDDPGPVMTDGIMYNTGVYHEPTEAATVDTTHDTTSFTKDTDTVANFSNINIAGNFYNSTRGGTSKDMMGNDISLAKNLSLNFNNTKITGVISASTAKHAIDTITSEEYEELGEVTNTPSVAVNNGVIVSLNNGSTWTVTGNSYLTGITITDSSKIMALNGYKVTMKVDGVATNIAVGTYKGKVEVGVTQITN